MIITDIAKLKEIIPTIIANTDDAFDRYQPYLKKAEAWLKREVVGPALIDLLSDDANDELLQHCCEVVAYKGYLEAIPMLDLVETENGFAVVGDGNLAPASTARVEALKKGIAASLTEAVEDLLEFLEESEEYHDAWKASKTYAFVNDNYFSSLRQFREFAEFTGGRLDFIAARPRLAKWRRLKIEPVISQELSSEIIEELRDDDLSEANTKIIVELRASLASFATGADADGESYLARIKKVLVASPEDYPAFESSSVYTEWLAEQQSTDVTDIPLMSCGL